MTTPATQQHWRDLSVAIATYLAKLEDGDFFIIAHHTRNYYVQVAGEGEHGLRIEATSNIFIEPPSAALTTVQYARMSALGWHRATAHPAELQKGRRTPDSSPNFNRRASPSEDLHGVADIMTRTLQEVYEITTPTLLHYQSFNRTLGAFACPAMPIAQRVERD